MFSGDAEARAALALPPLGCRFASDWQPTVLRLFVVGPSASEEVAARPAGQAARAGRGRTPPPTYHENDGDVFIPSLLFRLRRLSFCCGPLFFSSSLCVAARYFLLLRRISSTPVVRCRRGKQCARGGSFAPARRSAAQRATTGGSFAHYAAAAVPP